MTDIVFDCWERSGTRWACAVNGVNLKNVASSRTVYRSKPMDVNLDLNFFSEQSWVDLQNCRHWHAKMVDSTGSHGGSE